MTKTIDCLLRPHRFALFAVIVLLAGLIARAHAETSTFSIDPQDLSGALKAFAVQSHREIFFAPELARGKKSKGVKGTVDDIQALKAILEGTGLNFSITASNAILVKGPSSKNESSPAPAAPTSGSANFGTSAHLALSNTTGTQSQPGSGNSPAIRDTSSNGEGPGGDEYKGRIPEILVRASRILDVDLTRTENDVQPYYIFAGEEITRSGATDLNEFLQRHLTMNTADTSILNLAGTGVIDPSKATTQINLRGLGSDETLILVDGRRLAGTSFLGALGHSGDNQPDISGIPLSAIERIEVLPTSASAIYGGSAVGGVINIILKKNYNGGDVRVAYDRPQNANAPITKVSGTYGFPLEGGATQVMLSFNWKDEKPLLLGDREQIYNQAFSHIARSFPALIFATSPPPTGSTPNIQNASGTSAPITSAYIPDPLVLANGTVLPSGITHISPGTSPSTSPAALYSQLAANQGQYNYNQPNSRDDQFPAIGLLSSLTPENLERSFMATVRRQMLPWLDAFVDISINDSHFSNNVSPFLSTGIAFIPAGTPGNPFMNSVLVSFPSVTNARQTMDSLTTTATAGLIAKLGSKWTVDIDYTWSRNTLTNDSYASDPTSYGDVANGTLSPFFDTLHYLNTTKYLAPATTSESTRLQDIAIRAFGSLPALPWGAPELAIGLEHRVNNTPDRTYDEVHPLDPTNTFYQTFFPRRQTVNDAYGELHAPLVAQDLVPGVHSLELQAAGRVDQYTASAGTNSATFSPSTGMTRYDRPVTAAGGPIFEQASYQSRNSTLGLKYMPIPALIARVSYGTAFLPPGPSDLSANPVPLYQRIHDPKSNLTYTVPTLIGGNASVTPQSSKSLNEGLVWEPRGGLFAGLRVDIEHYSISQFNAITSLSAQQFINLESAFPSRVTRNSFGAITSVNATEINLFRHDTAGWDFSAGYQRNTSIGTLTFRLMDSLIERLATEYNPNTAEYNAVNFPSEGGAIKNKATAQVAWAREGWTASWYTRYLASYKQYGAPGGPSYTQNPGPSYYVMIQGSDSIPSQMYHDLVVSYAFHHATPDEHTTSNTAPLDGLTVQFGVKNVLNKIPPFDYAYAPLFYSPYTDPRLRDFWLTVRKTF